THWSGFSIATTSPTDASAHGYIAGANLRVQSDLKIPTPSASDVDTDSVANDTTYGNHCDDLDVRNPHADMRDRVITASGSHYEADTDISSPGLGIPLAITRSDNSADTATSLLCVGWSVNVGAHLDGQGCAPLSTCADIAFVNDDGQRVYFDRNT